MGIWGAGDTAATTNPVYTVSINQAALIKVSVPVDARREQDSISI